MLTRKALDHLIQHPELARAFFEALEDWFGAEELPPMKPDAPPPPTFLIDGETCVDPEVAARELAAVLREQGGV